MGVYRSKYQLWRKIIGHGKVLVDNKISSLPLKKTSVINVIRSMHFASKESANVNHLILETGWHAKNQQILNQVSELFVNLSHCVDIVIGSAPSKKKINMLQRVQSI